MDRAGTLGEGLRLELQAIGDPHGDPIGQHVHASHPQGLSRHGWQYMLGAIPREHNSGMLELLLEATRKIHYPDKPCRFHSMFACETIEMARRFGEIAKMPNSPIFEIHANSETAAHRGDMKLLAANHTIVSIDYRIHQYWRGLTIEDSGHVPLWECVVPLPATVGERVL